MRNLRGIQYEQWRPPVQYQNKPVTAAAWDLANDAVLIRVKTNSKSHEDTLITSWEAPSPNPDLACDKVLSLHYFGDSLTTCLVLAGGDIVVVREDPQPGEARWSPDEELLAITTKENTVIWMSRSFDGVADTTMTKEDLKASNHVSVGWGKKETQFQGRGAKALRDPTMPEKIDEGVLSPNDDSNVTISWRGDGAYLAISTIESASRRIVRVYSREGELDSVSEPVDGLEGALSWRPSGNLIAGIQRLKERIDVVFFERNGLRHGEFSLRLTQEQRQLPNQHIKLAWNSDSTVLAVVLADCTQLWTMASEILSVAEDTIDLAEYIFTTARGTLAPPHDFGVLAVIDGQNLTVTPFRVANVPPPMGHHEVTIQSNAIDVSINADASLLAVLHQEGIMVFDLDATKRVAPTPAFSRQFTFESASKTTIYQQITFSGKNEVLALGQGETGPVIQGYHFTEIPGEIKEKSLKNNPTSSVSILSSFVEDGIMHPYVQTSSGDLHSLAFGDVSLSSCTFGLSNNGHLFANTRLLVRNCTSFLVTPAHLIFTTTTHLLKFVHITEVHDLEIPPDDPEIDERCRSIERGARLVTAMPTSLSLILQMPRGNLETIFPRAMVLAGIRKLIDEKNYRKASLIAEPNVVALFIDQVKKITYIDLFLSSLREEDVTQTMYKETRVLPQNGSTLPTADGAYSVNPVAPQAPLDITITKVSKVNKICDAFLEVLKTRTATNLQKHYNIQSLYAQYLESKSSYKEAALAYESLNNYAKATSCYLASGPSQWRETLFCALTGGADGSPMSGSALTELANTLYDALIESKDYYAAATIQLEYISSLETALRAFCKGYFFADALHLLALKGRPDLLESVIDPGLGDALASSTELLADCKAQLLAQVPRIRELRQKALADPLAFYEGERGGDGELPDDVSVAASSRRLHKSLIIHPLYREW
ncbi:hypothetical protein DID88_001941 [Monilinia fructigena]|uniref:Elongator complex protein 1 n=1 Tax=Monilinia fructigena TaxID=38457 RepID=A0A395IVY7_9HELO|nr:hypothetical protein DID88_001941 [Monilinia fructigena]